MSALVWLAWLAEAMARAAIGVGLLLLVASQMGGAAGATARAEADKAADPSGWAS